MPLYAVEVTKTWTEPVWADSAQEAETLAEGHADDFDSEPGVDACARLASKGEFGSAIPWGGLDDRTCEELEADEDGVT